MSKIRCLPLVALPPATSTINAKGLASYNNRSFPAGLSVVVASKTPKVCVVVATNNLHKQLMATNTIIAAVNNRHNHIQPSCAVKMAWVAQRAPCGLAFLRNQTRGCAHLHS
jgi:Mrp family chromosome partitioning ATPase